MQIQGSVGGKNNLVHVQHRRRLAMELGQAPVFKLNYVTENTTEK
jgi:hypothetical protein